MGRWIAWLAPLVLWSACKDKTDPGTSEDPPGDSGIETNAYCDALGFSDHPFDESAEGVTYNEVLPDFELPTSAGAFVLSEVWTGCDVVVLVPVDQDFISEDTSEMLSDADPNTQFVFFSVASDDDDAAAAVEEFREDLEHDFDDELVAEWGERLHYVTVGTDNDVLDEIVDGLQSSQLAGIDQNQRLRRGGSMYVASTSDWYPMVTHARYTAKGYNYEARLEDRLAGEEDALGDDLLVLTLLEDDWADGTQTVEEVEGIVEVELPEAEEMARFDRAEIVFREYCDTVEFPHEGASCTGEVGLHVYVCESDCQDEDEQYKFFKAISGYYTGGWWTLDATQILPLLQRGGTQTFLIDEANHDEDYDWQANITLRLYDEVDDSEAHPTASQWMPGWTGMGLQSVYDELTPTYRIVPPQGTTRVEFRNLATTHGGGGSGGCGEFCTTEQNIVVNGQTFEHVWEQLDTWDCAARVDEGVTPNQWGTWYYDRASWCPGFTGELWISDLTDAFDLSGDNELTLTATQSGDYPYTGTLQANPWLVFYGGEGEPTIEQVDPEGCTNLHVRLRDFEDSFADFLPMVEAYDAMDSDSDERDDASEVVYDAVASTLSEVDGVSVPELVWPENTQPFSTADNFAMWFQDVDGINMTTDLDDQVRRTQADTAMIISHGISSETLPSIVDESFGFGVGEHDRLGSKTVEVWSTNTYEAGQQLRFASTDDLWVFLDGDLVIDSGGFNGHLSSYNGYQRTHVLELDDHDLEEGQSYELHAFIADRADDSNFYFWAEAPQCVSQ